MNLIKLDKFVLREYLLITLGTVATALGLTLFLIPNKLVAGGISGIGIILFHTMGLPVGLSYFIFNVLLFLVAFRVFGGPFGIKSIYAVVLLSASIDLLHYLFSVAPLTNELLIATIFGNLLIGAGLAMVFNQDASTGGMDILARLLSRYSGIELGKALLVFDFSVAALAGIVFHSVETAMYSFLSVFIIAFTIDGVMDTINSKVSILIISQKPDEVLKRVLKEVDSGATVFHATGGFGGKEQKVIMTIGSRRKMVRVKKAVREVDKDGFLIVSSVKEVLGEGFGKNIA